MEFGKSVAIKDGRLAVGAKTPAGGKVEVFTRSGSSYESSGGHQQYPGPQKGHSDVEKQPVTSKNNQGPRIDL